MVGYMNAEALTRTIETGEAHYWSRSRRILWHKGTPSEFVQHVDVKVSGSGASCHVGYRSCFYRKVPVANNHIISQHLIYTEAGKTFDSKQIFGDTPNGSSGAYRIQFKLFESLPQSDLSVFIAVSPIAIVFNRGFETESYELAVSAADGLDNNAVYAAQTGVLTIERVNALGTVYKVKMQSIGNNQF